MNEPQDLITHAFRAHEQDVPDALTVLANASGLSRRYRRGRRAAQATGGAVLGVGLLAGAVNAPSLFASSHHADTVATFASGGPAPTPTPTYTQEQELSQYFTAGYDYHNAVDLARLWHTTDIDATKAEAGLKLLQGETLPVSPHSAPAAPEDKAVLAFFNAGYSYDEAVRLGQMWHEPDTYKVKIKAGTKVENGEPLPFAPREVTLRRRTGFEVELLAPRGQSRRDLAEDLARRCAGEVVAVWHRDSEPSLVPGLGRFLHLTQGFEVRRPTGELLCTLVDDITIVDDLDLRSPPLPGWHRVLTDDPRLLDLLARHCDPAGPLENALDPAAALWGTSVNSYGGILQLNDTGGATVALASAHGGERERPCEIVTPPISEDHAARLEELLGPARELGFTIPAEAAVHLHLDAAPFRDPSVLVNVILLFSQWREPLWELLETNPRCRRLAPLPEDLVRVAEREPTWEDLARAAAGMTKFHDVNLTQLFSRSPLRETVEIRILPGALHGSDITRRAALVEQLLGRCLEGLPEHAELRTLLG